MNFQKTCFKSRMLISFHKSITFINVLEFKCGSKISNQLELIFDSESYSN